MENERIMEIDFELMQLKSNYVEVYSWIILKEKQKNLKVELSSNNSIKNCGKNRKELQEVEDEMKHMKKKYSSIMLYDSLISIKQKMLAIIKDNCDK
ncbi:MAG: hypothetical protein PHD15_05210 [Clostridia bacterium]|nr:hypothetical protein [Clostridia bacterium]MDD4387133.1 hypothetical protein [Clostridia bacterium]